MSRPSVAQQYVWALTTSLMALALSCDAKVKLSGRSKTPATPPPEADPVEPVVNDRLSELAARRNPHVMNHQEASQVAAAYRRFHSSCYLPNQAALGKSMVLPVDTFGTAFHYVAQWGVGREPAIEVLSGRHIVERSGTRDPSAPTLVLGGRGTSKWNDVQGCWGITVEHDHANQPATAADLLAAVWKLKEMTPHSETWNVDRGVHLSAARAMASKRNGQLLAFHRDREPIDLRDLSDEVVVPGSCSHPVERERATPCDGTYVRFWRHHKKPSIMP